MVPIKNNIDNLTGKLTPAPTWDGIVFSEKYEIELMRDKNNFVPLHFIDLTSFNIYIDLNTII